MNRVLLVVVVALSGCCSNERDQLRAKVIEGRALLSVAKFLNSDLEADRATFLADTLEDQRAWDQAHPKAAIK